MSEGFEGTGRDRGRGTVDPDRAPVGLWIGAIVAVAALAGAGYLIFGRDEPTPPSLGAALTIGDATTILVTAQEAGGDLVEPDDDSPATALTLADVDPDDDCTARLVPVGLLAWDPLAGGTDEALATEVLVDGRGAALGHEVRPWPGDDLSAVRDAVEECDEVALAGEQGEGTATLSLDDPTGEAADIGDDRLAVTVTISTEGDDAPRTTYAVVSVRDEITSTVAVTGPADGGGPPVDEARTATLAAAADERLAEALDHVS